MYILGIVGIAMFVYAGLEIAKVILFRKYVKGDDGMDKVGKILAKYANKMYQDKKKGIDNPSTFYSDQAADEIERIFEEE